jgi:cobalamin biosynthesis protein CobT
MSKRKKLDSKSILCILLATLQHGNYRVYDLATKKVHVSRNVVFSETEFPAYILSSKRRDDCMESQSDFSDSSKSLGMGTHSSSGDVSEANFEFERDGEASADGEEDQDGEEVQDAEEFQDEDDHESQGGTGESADNEYAAQRSPSIGTKRSPDE